MKAQRVGLKIRKLKPYYDNEIDMYVAECPDDDCEYLIKEGEIHQGEGRCYIFTVDDDE